MNSDKLGKLDEKNHFWDKYYKIVDWKTLGSENIKVSSNK